MTSILLYLLFLYLLENRDIINLIVVLIGTGGLSGAIYTFFKVRPEVNQIIVTSAQGAVVVQTGVIDNLRKELLRVQEENTQIRLEYLKTKTENNELRERLEQMEDKVKDLMERTKVIEKNER